MTRMLAPCLLAFATGVEANCLRPSAVTAAAVDTVTTAVALQQGAIERNPLGFVGATVGKGVYLAVTRLLFTPSERESGDRLVSSLWAGAAINNVMIIAGASNPIGVAVGVTAGVFLFRERCEKLDQDQKEETK